MDAARMALARERAAARQYIGSKPSGCFQIQVVTPRISVLLRKSIVSVARLKDA